MRRRTISHITICAAVLAGLLPLVILSHLLRVRAVEAQRLHLDEYARWTLVRADRTLGEARGILTKAEALRARDCSTEHMAWLRDLVMDAQDVRELGFFRDGRLLCTSADLSSVRSCAPCPMSGRPAGSPSRTVSSRGSSRAGR